VPDLPWFVYAMLLAPLGLILVAAAYKTLQVRAIGDWPSTPGKVVTSNSGLREIKVLDDSRENGHRFEQHNFANIAYEYSVSGQTLSNNRVSIGEDRGNFQVAETIARYPVGAVVTVYYNPQHPREAVLERGLPHGLWGCLGIATAITLAIVFGSAIGLHRISEFAGARLANPQMSVPVVALAAIGLVAALFALVLRQQAARALTWPVVAGIIKLSGFEEYRAARQWQPRHADVQQGGVVQLSLQLHRLQQCARHPEQQLQDDVAVGAAAVGDGLSGRRQRQGLGQPG
jgi:hypothetical protein